MEKKNCLRGIVFGALFAFIYGWDVFSGNASANVWGCFMAGLAILTYGLLLWHH